MRWWQRPLYPTKLLVRVSDSTMSNEELTDLKGVGPALKNKLAKLNINKQSDLLFLLPTRYEDRTKLKKNRRSGPRRGSAD